MSVSFLGSQAALAGTLVSGRRQANANATAHVKGTYVQNIAASTYPAAWVQVTLLRASSAVDYLVDVAVGAAGVEQVIIPNLPHSCNSTASAPEAVYLFPLFIPAGTRIATRCQASTGSSIIDHHVNLFAPMFGGELGLGQVEACGAVTATSLGTSVDPGGTINTKGSWAPLITATTIPYKWVCVSINHTNVVTLAQSWTVDIGFGAGGVEVVVVPDLCVFSPTTSDTIAAIGLCFPLAIPAGTRVSARAQCSVTTSPDRLLEIVLHGVG